MFFNRVPSTSSLVQYFICCRIMVYCRALLCCAMSSIT